MYENQSEKDWSYVLQDSGSEVVFCATDDIKQRVKSLNLSHLKHVFSHQSDMPDLLHAGKGGSHDPQLHSEDLCGIIYTSGTSGNPKGVELTHANITSNVMGISYLFEDTIANKRCLSFLPWAHAYAQTVELHSGLHLGMEFALCSGIDHIKAQLGQAEPHILFSVPSLFEKIYAGVQSNVQKQSPLKQRLFHSALRLALKKRVDGQALGLGESLQFALLNKVVLQKVKAALGEQLEIAVSGGARLDPTVMRFFSALGLEVYEGYGLTETSPILAANSPAARAVDSVGRPLPGVTITLRDPETDQVLGAPGAEGQVCASGPNIFRRYHNLPEETARDVFEEDGVRVFRTGDLGTFTPEGMLRITGRIKEQYKLQNGKFVIPTQLESAINRSRFIDQTMVHGSNLPANVAIVVPNWPEVFEKLKVAPKDQNVAHYETSQSVVTLLLDEIKSQTTDFAHYAVPRHILFAGPFTVENEMATPKMSLKRNNILKVYHNKVEKMFEKK
jgi:long-chain acyl-CoA synthetase